MTDAGFFRGTSTEQDVRFSDKDKKLLKTMKFEGCLEQKVDLHKVNFEALKPWVAEQVTKILGIEDEVVVELVFSFLEHERFPNAKKLQILVTGFLQSKPARIFIGQLWGLLLNAQENPSKLPDKFIEEKKDAIRQQKKLIEKELNIRDEPKRYSPDKDEYYRRPHGRYRESPRRSPHWRTTERREKGNISDIGTQVQKSEASSTQADLEQPGPTSASTLSRVENMIKSVEQVMQQQHTKDVHKGEDPRREDHKERSRSRSRNRSYSPSRRHRSRSHERGDSKERRYRPRRLSPPHRRHRPSPSPYSPDSHSHHQRGRGYGRDSPHHSRPLRSPENRHRQEAPADQHKHTELHYQGPSEKRRLPHREVQDRPDRRDSNLLPTQDAVEMRHTHVQKQSQEVHRSKKRSPHVQKESRPGRDAREGRGRKVSNTSSSPSSSSSSSGSASPVKERKHGREAGRQRKNSSSSSSDSSESSNLDARNRSRQDPAKNKTHAKPSSKTRRELDPVPRKEPIRESSKRGGVHTKRKPQQQRSSHQHRVNSQSDKSEHTSDNFSELEHKRRSSLRSKKQKQGVSSKRKHQRERYNVAVRSKVRMPQKKRRGSIDISVGVSKRKHTTQRPPSSDISDESEDNSELEEVSKNALKRKQRQMSPSTVKRARHRKSLTLDSSSVSSESEESSSSESESEEQKRRRDKRKEKGSGKERKRILASGDSSEIESRSREKGRSSLEKHLRGKMIQAMSKKRQRKSKN